MIKKLLVASLIGLTGCTTVVPASATYVRTPAYVYTDSVPVYVPPPRVYYVEPRPYYRPYYRPHYCRYRYYC